MPYSFGVLISWRSLCFLIKYFLLTATPQETQTNWGWLISAAWSPIKKSHLEQRCTDFLLRTSVRWCFECSLMGFIIRFGEAFRVRSLLQEHLLFDSISFVQKNNEWLCDPCGRIAESRNFHTRGEFTVSIWIVEGGRRLQFALLRNHCGEDTFLCDVVSGKAEGTFREGIRIRRHQWQKGNECSLSSPHLRGRPLPRLPRRSANLVESKVVSYSIISVDCNLFRMKADDEME